MASPARALGTHQALWSSGRSHRFGGHRPRVDNRRAKDATFSVARTGCRWNSLNATGICSSSSTHRRFQEWGRTGVFERRLAQGLEEYDELEGMDWFWQAMDGARIEASLGGGRHRPQSRAPRQAGRQARPAD